MNQPSNPRAGRLVPARPSLTRRTARLLLPALALLGLGGVAAADGAHEAGPVYRAAQVADPVRPAVAPEVTPSSAQPTPTPSPTVSALPAAPTTVSASVTPQVSAPPSAPAAARVLPPAGAVAPAEPEVEGALPVEKGEYRRSATFGATGSWSRYHTGIDFAAATGTPVSAVTAGVVVESSAGSWAGTHVVVEAEDGSHTLYAHLSVKSVAPGDAVAAGDRIGAVGETGRSFGAHLHLEYYEPGVRPGDVYEASDPADLLGRLGLSL